MVAHLAAVLLLIIATAQACSDRHWIAVPTAAGVRHFYAAPRHLADLSTDQIADAAMTWCTGWYAQDDAIATRATQNRTSPIRFHRHDRMVLGVEVNGQAQEVYLNLPGGGENQQEWTSSAIEGIDTFPPAIRAQLAAHAAHQLQRARAAEQACADALATAIPDVIAEAEGNDNARCGTGDLQLGYLADFSPSSDRTMPTFLAPSSHLPLAPVLSPALRAAVDAREDADVCVQLFRPEPEPLVSMVCRSWLAKRPQHEVDRTGKKVTAGPSMWNPIEDATSEMGNFELKNLRRGTHTFVAFVVGKHRGRGQASELLAWATYRVEVRRERCPARRCATPAHAIGGDDAGAGGGGAGTGASTVRVFDQPSYPHTSRWAQLRNVAFDAVANRVLIFDGQGGGNDRESVADGSILLANNYFGVWDLRAVRRAETYDERRCARVFDLPTIWSYCYAAENRVHYFQDCLLPLFTMARARFGGTRELALIFEPTLVHNAAKMLDPGGGGGGGGGQEEQWTRAWLRAVSDLPPTVWHRPSVWAKAAPYRAAGPTTGGEADEIGRALFSRVPALAATGPGLGLTCFRHVLVGMDRSSSPWHWGYATGGEFLKTRARFESPDAFRACAAPMADDVGAFKGRLHALVNNNKELKEPAAALSDCHVVFVKRRTRQLLNLNELTPIARKRGCRVTVAKLEEMSWREQAALFQATTVLVGMSGQGFYGTMFMRPKRSAAILVVPARQKSQLFVHGNAALVGGVHVFPVYSPHDTETFRDHTLREVNEGWRALTQGAETNVYVAVKQFDVLLAKALEAAGGGAAGSAVEGERPAAWLAHEGEADGGGGGAAAAHTIDFEWNIPYDDLRYLDN